MDDNKFSLTNVLNLYTIEDINVFQRLNGILTFEGSRLKYSDIQSDWAMFGGNESNNSVIGILANGDNGIIERVTNAIDAVIEYEKEKNNIGSAKTPDVVVSKVVVSLSTFADNSIPLIILILLRHHRLIMLLYIKFIQQILRYLFIYIKKQIIL